MQYSSACFARSTVGVCTFAIYKVTDTKRALKNDEAAIINKLSIHVLSRATATPHITGTCDMLVGTYWRQWACKRSYNALGFSPYRLANRKRPVQYEDVRGEAIQFTPAAKTKGERNVAKDRSTVWVNYK
ncbi:hypothetical protein TRVL_05762 [Trypanosoma vivax]|nr:hypothetical protein TRVL_05762 [Trypanosoma vivax]